MGGEVYHQEPPGLEDQIELTLVMLVGGDLTACQDRLEDYDGVVKPCFYAASKFLVIAGKYSIPRRHA